MSKIAIFATALLLITLPAKAGEAKSNHSPTLLAYNQVDRPLTKATSQKAKDRELSVKQAEFDRFAIEKVKQFNRNFKFSKEKMQITKLADGSYLARYHQIDKATLHSSIRRSQSKYSPFVGVLSYRENVYEAHGKSPEGCRKSTFTLVQITPNRHIFSYSKGEWR